MTLRFFVICYGEANADLLERVAIRSLTQPQNKAAVPSGAVVALYSDEATMERAKAACERLAPVEVHLIKLRSTADSDVNVFAPGALYDVQNGVFIEELERCVKADAGIVIVNPDCFWGDGSLGNLLAIAGEQNVAVAAAHPRVDRDKFLGELESIENLFRIANYGLVGMAMRSLHRSWEDARTENLPDGGVLDNASDKRSGVGSQANSYFTGIGIRSIGNGIHIVHHLQPTVWYARPTARDYAYFAARPTARGVWDHFWPEILAQEQRIRTVASSDAVFIAELTDAKTHNTELMPVDPKNPTKFHKDGPHIALQRNIVHVWREG